ncbi:hypothetical protein [Streptomyces sp. NPDC056160]|uniref:hypothetical protein n=1 Tax=Streptomyces sp. NPDC056160 TaxID=3345731 RepID=UPI0035DC5119
MKKAIPVLIPLAILGAVASPIMASEYSHGGSTTDRAVLQPVPLNGRHKASGSLTLLLRGNQATVEEHVSGVATTFMNAPYPHVQHLHGGATGACPTDKADASHDGVARTADGKPSYRAIRTTTLPVSGATSRAAGTNTEIAPGFAHHRTIRLDAATLQSIRKRIAVIVVHGLDPATRPRIVTRQRSEPASSLPPTATSPALYGHLKAGHVGKVPTAAAATGSGASQSVQNTGLFAAGGALPPRPKAPW